MTHKWQSCISNPILTKFKIWNPYLKPLLLTMREETGVWYDWYRDLLADPFPQAPLYVLWVPAKPHDQPLLFLASSSTVSLSLWQCKPLADGCCPKEVIAMGRTTAPEGHLAYPNQMKIKLGSCQLTAEINQWSMQYLLNATVGSVAASLSLQPGISVPSFYLLV